jgi:lysine 2,3-aminomutase
MNAPIETTLRTTRQLAAAGVLGDDPALDRVAARYAVAVTASMAAVIAAEGRDGPVGRQYLPTTAELTTTADETGDPTGDEAHSPVKGIVHRYPDRALLMPTQVCAVYCRFCFRRERVGPEAGALDDASLAAALGYIEGQPQIWEVILSGGDPLVLSPRRLTHIVASLDRIAHVATIRIHSRVPVAAPERITDAVLAALAATQKPVYLVVHCNHAAELTPAARATLRRIRDAGVTVLAQGVLLKGVNDTEAALENLFRGLLSAGAKPYYLHHLDPAPGTSHFAVPIERGRALMKALRGRVSGLALPTYILDVPGGSGKIPVGPDYVRGVDGGYTVVEGLDRRHHRITPNESAPDGSH